MPLFSIILTLILIHIIPLYRVPRNETCTRWEEIGGITRSIASLANAAETPCEIKLLNRADTVTVGLENDLSVNLGRVQCLMADVPRGETPICKKVREVIAKMKEIEGSLRDANLIALLIILSDGPATDGDLVSEMKPLEGMPVQVIVRVCSDESPVIEYWHDVNAQCDINFLVLDDIEVNIITHTQTRAQTLRSLYYYVQ